MNWSNGLKSVWLKLIYGVELELFQYYKMHDLLQFQISAEGRKA